MAKSVDLKEQAFAKFQAAAALEGDDGTVGSEESAQYDALVQEGMELDRQAGEAERHEGNQSTLRERLSEYQERATGMPMVFNRTTLDPRGSLSLGQQFVGSKTYKDLIASGALRSTGQSFKTEGVVAFAPHGQSAAASDIINTDPSGGTIAAPPAQRLPGIYAYGQRPPTVRDLFVNDTTTADVIEYVAQTSFDKASGSLAVKQSTSPTDAAGLKKQSSVGWEVRDAKAEILATWFAATRKAIAQEDTVRSFIDNQGRYMLMLEEEDQLINGNGTSPNLSGLLDQDDRLTLDVAAVGLDNLDAVRRAKRLVKTGVSRLPVDWIVLNPEDGEGFDLLKDEVGQYRVGNPMAAGVAEDSPIWRARRVESEAIEAGTALVGSRIAATVFQRRPITVLTADQHADFFIRNLVVILFEEELAFPVYFPTAILELTLDEWPTAGS